MMPKNDQERHYERHPDSWFRSPYHSDKHRKRKRSPMGAPVELPFGASPLSKRDYESLKDLFALYLDIQKQIVLEDLDDREARGRWKSFVSKWNRGELLEGWYDPSTLSRARTFAARPPSPRQTVTRKPSSSQPHTGTTVHRVDDDDDDDNDDDYGPNLPTTMIAPPSRRSQGPAAPSLDELALRHDQEADANEQARSDLRHERRVVRKQEQAHLDELAPKAEAGTRERQLEKKWGAAAANRTFAAAKTDAVGGAVEVRDEDLMGGLGDGLEEYRRMKQGRERKKTKRELRREELLSAKQAEREERMAAYRVKEEKTMEALIALAKQRFG